MKKMCRRKQLQNSKEIDSSSEHSTVQYSTTQFYNIQYSTHIHYDFTAVEQLLGL